MPDKPEQRSGSVAPWLVGGGLLAFGGYQGYKHFGQKHLGNMANNLGDEIKAVVPSVEQTEQIIKPSSSTEFWHKFDRAGTPAAGIGATNSFMHDIVDVEDAHYKGFDEILTPKRAAAYNKIVTAQLTDFQSVMNNTHGTNLLNIEAINESINSANTGFIDGISERAKRNTETAGLIGRSDVEDIFFAHYGRKGKRAQEFIAREQAAVSQLEDIASRLTASTGHQVKIQAINRSGVAPEIGLRVGGEFISMGAATGTRLQFGSNVYQGPQAILGRTAEGRLKTMTFHEASVNVLEQKMGELKGIKSSSQLRSKISGILSEPREAAIFSSPEDKMRAIAGVPGQPMSAADVARSGNIVTMPSIVKESGAQASRDAAETLRRITEWAGKEDWDETTRARMFHIKPGQRITPERVLRHFVTAVKGDKVDRLTFSAFTSLKALTVGGMLTPFQNIAKEGGEELRTGLLRKSQSAKYKYNKYYGYGREMRRQNLAGLLAGEGSERLAGSVSGKVHAIDKVQKLIDGEWVDVPDKLVGALGGKFSGGSGVMAISEEFGDLSHESSGDYMLKKISGSPNKKIKDTINELARKGKLDVRNLKAAGITVRKKDAQGLLRTETGSLEFSQAALKQASETENSLVIPGKRLRKISESGYAFRLGPTSVSATRGTRFIGKGSEGVLGALWSTNIKPEVRSQMAYATIQSLMEESDIKYSRNLDEFAATISGELDRADPNARYFKGVEGNQKRWQQLTDLMTERMQKEGVDKRSLDKFRASMEGYGPGKTIEFAAEGQHYRARATTLTGTAFPRMYPLEEETALHGTVGRYKSEYTKKLDDFNKALAGHEDLPGVQRFMEAQTKKHSILEDVLRHESVPDTLIRNFNEAETQQLEAIREIQRMEGGPIKGIEKKFIALKTSEEQFMSKLTQRAQSTPRRYRPQDFMMMAIKAHADPENRDTGVLEYLLRMQEGSQARRSFQNVAMAAEPLFGTSTKQIIEEVDKGILFGNKAFSLSNPDDVEQLKVITNVMGQIKDAADSADDEVVNAMSIQDILRRSKGQFEAAGLGDVNPEELLSKNLAITGMPEGTFMDLEIEQALKTGTDKFLVSSKNQREMILPSLGATGRLFGKGPNAEMISLNEMRRSILGAHHGLSLMLEDGENIDALRSSYATFLKSLAEESHKTGLFGRAGELQWTKSAYPNIRQFDFSDMRRMDYLRQAKDWAGYQAEAATVHISREMAEEFGALDKLTKKGADDLYAHMQSYPGLTPGMQRTVKLRLDENLRGRQMKVGYGIAIAGARDFDADRVALMYLGDEHEVVRNLLNNDPNLSKSDAKAMARKFVSSMKQDFRADAESIAYLQHSEMKLAQRVADANFLSATNKLHKDANVNAVRDIVNYMGRIDDVEIKSGAYDDEIQRILSKHDISGTAADTMIDVFKKKLVASKELGVTTNKLMMMRNTLADNMIRDKGSRQATDFAIQYFHQITQSLISARKHGEKGDASRELIELLQGRSVDGDFKNLTRAHKDKIGELLGESLVEGGLAGEVKDRWLWRSVDEGVYDSNQVKWIIDEQAQKLNVKSFNELKETFVNLAEENLRRRNEWDESNFLFETTMKKSGLGRFAERGQWSVRQFIEQAPKHMKKLGAFVKKQADLPEFARLVSHITGINAIAAYADDASRATIREAEKTASDALNYAKAGDAAADIATSKGKSWLTRLFDKSDEYLAGSPKAKYALAGAAITGAAAFTFRMFSDPTMPAPERPGPAAPPAMPMDPRQRGITQYQGAPPAPVSPSYGLADRFISSGLSAAPEIAVAEMTNSLDGRGSFDIMDQSLSDPQFQEEYESAQRGRF